VVAAILVGVIFVDTYFSKKRYLAVVRTQANEVLAANKGLLDEVSRRLASGKPEGYKRISEINDFLANQRSGLPQLTLIYSGKFTDRLAFYQVGGDFTGNLEKGVYTPVYFACTENLDCSYLTKFFSGGSVDALQKYTIRDEQFYIYIPTIGKEARFVFLFQKVSAYGKIGS
jgi:hypothetical protein